MLLGADVVSSIEGGGPFVIRSLDHILGLMNASPVDWIERTFPAGVSGALTYFLGLPAWLPSGVLGVLLALISGKRE
jgi:hypothetical protein